MALPIRSSALYSRAFRPFYTTTVCNAIIACGLHKTTYTLNRTYIDNTHTRASLQTFDHDHSGHRLFKDEGTNFHQYSSRSSSKIPFTLALFGFSLKSLIGGEDAEEEKMKDSPLITKIKEGIFAFHVSDNSLLSNQDAMIYCTCLFSLKICFLTIVLTILL